MKTITSGGVRYYTNPVAQTWRKVKAWGWGVFYALRLRAWNWKARRDGWATCEVCDDTRGGAIGNGNVIEGMTLCDYCTMDHRRNPRFWERKPETVNGGFTE